MQHLESATPPAAHLSSARWVRVSAAVALCLAGPTVSFAGVLTTGLSGNAAAVRFPPGYGVTLVATAAATIVAAVLAALIARRDALVAIPAALGLWAVVGVAAGIASVKLSPPRRWRDEPPTRRKPQTPAHHGPPSQAWESIPHRSCQLGHRP